MITRFTRTIYAYERNIIYVIGQMHILIWAGVYRIRQTLINLWKLLKIPTIYCVLYQTYYIQQDYYHSSIYSDHQSVLVYCYTLYILSIMISIIKKIILMNSSNPVLRPTQTELTPYRSSYKTKCRVIGYYPSYYGPASPLALMLMI